MFKQICLGLAVLAVVVMGWMVNDLRLELKQSAGTLNENLPEILTNTRKSTETLAALSDDIKQLRDLAGISNRTRDRTLVAYADSMLDLVEASEGQIGLKKKVFGSGLKELVPAKQWVVAARKEALWLSFRATSRGELRKRLCTNKFGSKWQIELEGKEPVELEQWIQQNLPPAGQP